MTGSWFDPGQNGQGFAIEVLPGQPLRMSASWFVFRPGGGQSWIVAQGPITGTRAVLQGYQMAGPAGDSRRRSTRPTSIRNSGAR